MARGLLGNECTVYIGKIKQLFNIHFHKNAFAFICEKAEFSIEHKHYLEFKETNELNQFHIKD